MACDQADDAGGRNNEVHRQIVGGTLQLLRSQRELSLDSQLLEVREICNLQDAESKGPEGEIQVRQISPGVELLRQGTAPDEGYLGMETDVGLKSCMRENRKYGSVRGSRQAFHNI